jgi:hypothetical protein
MKRMGKGTVRVLVLWLGVMLMAFFPGVGCAPLFYTKAEVDALINNLQSQITAHQNLLQGVTRSSNDIYITGANLHIRSGSGTTDGAVNGNGNLIIGYNELRGTWDVRTGSHNLIVGRRNNFSSYGGMVVGDSNTISGIHSSVSGGSNNTASGDYSSVAGGGSSTTDGGNIAFGHYTAILGGYRNKAGDIALADHTIGQYSTVSGGFWNTASGIYSSVSGGGGNTASGNYSSVLGGRGRNLSAEYECWPACW